MTDPNSGSQMAGPDDKTTVLPETAVALVEMERLQQELQASEERAKNHWEQYLRALADVDNVRKRAAKDLENTRQFAVEKFAQDLVAVKDSLELGIATLQKDGAAKSDAAGLVEGQNATLRLLAKAFEKAQIEEIHPEGADLQPRISRGHDGAAQRCAAEHGVVGRAEGLPIERKAAAARSRDRVGSEKLIQKFS